MSEAQVDILFCRLQFAVLMENHEKIKKLLEEAKLLKEKIDRERGVIKH